MQSWILTGRSLTQDETENDLLFLVYPIVTLKIAVYRSSLIYASLEILYTIFSPLIGRI